MFEIPLHPAAHPPEIVIDGSGTGDRLALACQIVELAPLDRLANQPIDMTLKTIG